MTSWTWTQQRALQTISQGWPASSKEGGMAWFKQAFKKNSVDWDFTLNCLSKLRKLESLSLLSQVLQICYFSATLPVKDPNKAMRERDTEILRHVKNQGKAVKTLCVFLRRYPEATNWAMGHALLKWKANHQGKAHLPFIKDQSLSPSRFLEEILNLYGQALEKGIPGVKKGPWIHRWQFGALLYPDKHPLDQQIKQPEHRLNSLLFHLAFLFRQATASKPILAMAGTPMPAGGKPHYDLILQFAYLVFPQLCETSGEEELGVYTIKARLFEIKKIGVTLGNWPQEIPPPA